MKKRKIPMRKDVLSQEMFPKRQLIRIVRDQQHQVTLDPTGKKSGRGAYVRIDVAAVKEAYQQRTLDQVFEIPLSDQFYEELIAYVDHLQARQELIKNEKL
ncbi:RNase P modulator RnpM [Fructilactobacillus florum]|uniref:YlxR domain-containing protein n=1 Tax=Fructilactobacillus florum DSM 22689 = JCM 16035 TaxID=1423745 RepID=A0A0R2CN78_9LACO|nr:YlxR family protein [Fructilactobacillus florum]KRM91396.1 hypothetical protein FC87_GL000907 [Fructilactobacillus florum DSM 22689 = JCM 16035]